MFCPTGFVPNERRVTRRRARSWVVMAGRGGAAGMLRGRRRRQGLGQWALIIPQLCSPRPPSLHPPPCRHPAHRTRAPTRGCYWSRCSSRCAVRQVVQAMCGLLCRSCRFGAASTTQSTRNATPTHSPSLLPHLSPFSLTSLTYLPLPPRIVPDCNFAPSDFFMNVIPLPPPSLPAPPTGLGAGRRRRRHATARAAH